MAEITVRQAVAADREMLEELITACYSAIYPGWYDADVLTDALPEMLHVDQRLIDSGRYFAATIDGRLAGCGGWSTFGPASAASRPANGHVRHFATHPDFMRMGVGAAILERCVEDAKAAGISELQCFRACQERRSTPATASTESARRPSCSAIRSRFRRS